MKIKIKKLHKDAVIPTYAHKGDMCMDMTAISVEYDKAMDCFIYHTGIAIEVPEGYGALGFPRSSNRRTNAYMTNHVGVIDSGYRGEILFCFKNRTPSLIISIINDLLHNVGKFISKNIAMRLVNKPPYEVGERIAQICIIPYPKIEFEEVEILSDSDRGTNGHGSTGKFNMNFDNKNK